MEGEEIKTTSQRQTPTQSDKIEELGHGEADLGKVDKDKGKEKTLQELRKLPFNNLCHIGYISDMSMLSCLSCLPHLSC